MNSFFRIINFKMDFINAQLLTVTKEHDRFLGVIVDHGIAVSQAV